MNITANDKELLERLNIDIINENRHYWLVRTQGGAYFDDFYFNDYVGIEWDNIVETNLDTLEQYKEMVNSVMPAETRKGYIAGQIYKFVKEFKQGDIVIIPNKDSKIFAFGEILDDDLYTEEKTIIDQIVFEEDAENEIQFLRKRRSVNWIKTVDRSKMDPHLQTFFHAHNTIVDLNAYAHFIDRTLSDFYIKGENAFYTMRVNKEQNVYLYDLADMFKWNRKICDFINMYMNNVIEISRGDLIYKIDVQSEGPAQITGPIKKILVFGFVIMTICGGTVSLNKEKGFEISSGGIVAIIDSAVNAYDVIMSHKDEADIEEYNELKKDYEMLKKELQLSTPGSNFY